MKDIMQKLAELEATAPKVSKKKMLKEDSTTPPMNVSDKPASLKDVFESIAGQKPIPVVGKEGGQQQTGAGFVNVTDPALQGLGKTIGDLAAQKKIQLVVPTQPGQAPQAGTTPAPAGATGQPQAGQQPMREKWGTDTKVAPSEKGKYAGKDKAELTKAYNKLKASGPHKKGSPEFGKMRELAFAIRAKSDWGKVQEEQLNELSPETLQSYQDKNKLRRKDSQAGGSPEAAKTIANRTTGWARSQDKLHGGAKVPANEGAKVDRMVKHIEKSERKLGKSKEKASDIAWATANKRGMLDNKNKKKVNEAGFPGAPDVEMPPMKSSGDPKRDKLNQEYMDIHREIKSLVDIPYSERSSPEQKARAKARIKQLDARADEIKAILNPPKPWKPNEWQMKHYNLDADGNPLDSVQEADIPSTNGIDTMGAGLGAGRSMTTLEAKEPQVEVIDNAFNRENYKDLIGKKYPKSKAPAYARVKEISEGQLNELDPKTLKNYRAIAKGQLRDMASLEPSFGKNQDQSKDRENRKAKRLKGLNMADKKLQDTLEEAKPDFLDLDKDGNKKESMKKAAADKKKQKVKESMNHRISAARLEGKSHGLRGHAHSGKRYEDLEEMKAYHEGYMEGIDECYGMGVYETAPAMPAATVPGMASQAMEDNLSLTAPATSSAPWPALITYKHPTLGSVELLGYDDLDIAQDHVDSGALTPKTEVVIYSKKDWEAPRKTLAKYVPQLKDLFDVSEGNAFTDALAKTPKGGKFTVGGKSYTDTSSLEEYAFESLDKQLNALLNESEEVNEGLSVSVSKGNNHGEDSVNINATGPESEELLKLVKHAGLGLFGDEAEHQPSSAMSIQPAHGAPNEVGAGGVDVEVVDGHDGIMGLMQKLSGIQADGQNDADYADEEGHKDCGCTGDCDCNEKTDEAMCNECGGMMEAGHSCGSKEMVDEVESEDQMEFEVAEDNAPDSETAEHNADEEAEAQEDAALAQAAQQNKTDTVNEGGDGGEASEEGPESKEGETDEEGETVSESFINLFKKLAFIAEESEAEKDNKAEKAGKKVAKDIEYDEGHKGKDDNKAEKAGEKVKKDIEYDDKKDKKEKVDESQLDEIFGFSQKEKLIKGNKQHVMNFASENGGKPTITPDGYTTFKLPLGQAGPGQELYVQGNMYDKDGQGRPLLVLRTSQHSKYPDHNPIRFYMDDAGFADRLNTIWAKIKAADKSTQSPAAQPGQAPVNEWANQVGKGEGKGTDASFEQDIEFMTKVIAGGLNKPKSTGQTTIPVIAGQEDRMHDNPQDWATLAGIKK